MDLENDLLVEGLDDLTDVVSAVEDRVERPRSRVAKAAQPSLPLRSSVLVGDLHSTGEIAPGDIMVVSDRDEVALTRLAQTWAAGVDDPAEASIAAEWQVLELSAALGVKTIALVPKAPVDQARLPKEIEMVPIGGEKAGSGLLQTLRVLIAALIIRPGVLLLMRPLQHLWPLRLAMWLGVRVVLVADDASIDQLSRGRLARFVEPWNRSALRRAEVALVPDASAAEKIRRHGVRLDDMQQFRPQFTDRWIGQVRDVQKLRPLASIAVVVRGKEREDVLRCKMAELTNACPELRVKILSRARVLDQVSAGCFGQIDVVQCANDDERMAHLREVDLAVLWPDDEGAASQDGLALQALVAGTPVLADHEEALPDWIAPAVKRASLFGRGGLWKTIERLRLHPSQLKRLRGAAAMVGQGTFDRNASLASRLLQILMR